MLINHFNKHKQLDEFEIKHKVHRGPLNFTNQQPNLDIDFVDTTHEESHTPQIEEYVDESDIQGD